MSLIDVAPQRNRARSPAATPKASRSRSSRRTRTTAGSAASRSAIPWHSQPRESYWARLAMPMAGNDRGI